VVPLIEIGQVDREVGRYLNRLSDFLFVAGRTASFREGRVEKIWRKSKI
jgi:cob(I)alamin adenosyltransferase